MRIRIIMPTMYDMGGKLLKKKKATLPNLTIYYLAGMVPQKHDVSVLDESVEDINFDEPLDLVGISTTTITAERAYEIADEYRKREVTVVIGGIHASCLPEEASQHADAVVVGEAEDSWPKAIDDFENRKLEKIYHIPRRASLEKLPYPRFDLLDHSKYKKMLFRKSPLVSVQTTRGCPHNCDFCAVTKFWGKKLRHRPINDVIEEIKLSNADTIFFTDDNFCGNYKYTEELCEKLIPLKIKYICQLDTNCYRRPDLINLLAKSGCFMCFIGFESIREDNLKGVNKGFNKPGEYKNMARLLHRNGLNIYASIIFGFDNDDVPLVKDTVRFLVEQRISICSFFPLTPFPGTAFYEQLKEQDRLLDDKWWLNNSKSAAGSGQIIYRNGQTDGFQLRQMALRQFYSWPSIMKRFSHVSLNRLFPFLLNISMRAGVKKFGTCAF